MKCFVTGASGFIGANLVHELVARGHRVKALLRPGADERGLAGAQFERATGDVSDRKLLEREIAGCDWCFHVAASYQLWMRDYAPMYAANVEGTRNVLEAAGQAGCQKLFTRARSAASACRRKVTANLTPTERTDARHRSADGQPLQALQMASRKNRAGTGAKRVCPSSS